MGSGQEEAGIGGGAAAGKLCGVWAESGVGSCKMGPYLMLLDVWWVWVVGCGRELGADVFLCICFPRGLACDRDH